MKTKLKAYILQVIYVVNGKKCEEVVSIDTTAICGKNEHHALASHLDIDAGDTSVADLLKIIADSYYSEYADMGKHVYVDSVKIHKGTIKTTSDNEYKPILADAERYFLMHYGSEIYKRS